MTQTKYSEEIVDLRRLYGCAKQIIWMFPVCCLLLLLLLSATHKSGNGVPTKFHKVSYFDFLSDTDGMGFLNQSFSVYPNLTLIIAKYNNDKSQFKTQESSVFASMNISLMDGSSTIVRIETASFKPLNIEPLISEIKEDYVRALKSSMSLFLRATKWIPTLSLNDYGLQARRQYILTLRGDPHVSVVPMTMGDSIDDVEPPVPPAPFPFKSYIFSLIGGGFLWFICALIFTLFKRKISADYDIHSVMGDVKVLSFPDYSSQQSRNRALGFLASADLGKSQLLMTGLTSEADSTHSLIFWIISYQIVRTV